jgi:membrane-bound metal-dependent hydrolase YbcI (DUF457 family)
MAGFKTHVTVSGMLGCGYAGAGTLYGMPLDTALVGGALCGFSGMLPDLDSDYGVPLRETMCFASATIPMLLLDRFASFGLRHDQMVLLAVSLYLFMRFGMTKMIRKYTVHRGMFHSIPAGLIFAGLAFLVCGSADVNMRYFKAGGVLAGFMSHLILDEIYSVEWKGGRWRLKKSSGTAFKLFGDDAWANFSTYAKLVVVAALIVGEPSVMRQIEARHPGFSQRYDQLRDRYRDWSGQLQVPEAVDAARAQAASTLQQFAPQPAEAPPPAAVFQPRSYQTATPPVPAASYDQPPAVNYDNGNFQPATIGRDPYGYPPAR